MLTQTVLIAIAFCAGTCGDVSWNNYATCMDVGTQLRTTHVAGQLNMNLLCDTICSCGPQSTRAIISVKFRTDQLTYEARKSDQFD